MYVREIRGGELARALVSCARDCRTKNESRHRIITFDEGLYVLKSIAVFT